MSTRIHHLPKKNCAQTSIPSMPYFAFSCPWWSTNDQKIPPSSSKSTTFKVESPSHLYYEAKHLGLQPPDQESSSAQSLGHSHPELGTAGGTSSQDQCISSESGQDDSCTKGMEGPMKPVLLFGNPDARAPYPCVDPYYGALFTPYGPQTLIQPQMGSQILGTSPARIPLPFDVAADGPIYVNAKQYHGILRRRQSRAKLEAQNKLVKSRKPYLHESRHLHALNRVRGSGGRFLSTKKLQQSGLTHATGTTDCISGSVQSHPNPKNNVSEFTSRCPGTAECIASGTTCSNITSISDANVIFQQRDHRFFGISSHVGGRMQSNGGLMGQHCASAVR